MNIIRLAVHRPIAMTMVMALVLLLGAVAMFGLEIDLFPELEFPIAAVLIQAPGTGPEEMEQLVTVPVEQTLATLPNIDEIRSTTRLGGSLVVLEFEPGTDMDRAIADMRERLDLIGPQLPAGSSDPTVMQFNPQDLPLMLLAVASPSMDAGQAKTLTETFIQPRLEQIDGISAVHVEGGREREILIRFDPLELQSHELTLSSMQRLLQPENVDVPGGLLVDRNREIPLMIGGRFESISDVEDLLIPTGTGELLPLSSLGDIQESSKPTTVLSMLNGQPSVGISIDKQPGANTAAVGREVHETLAAIQPDLPPGVDVAPIFDQSLYVKQSIRVISVQIVAGAILAGAVLLLFLQRLKPTLIIGLAIPISILATLSFMYASNQNLNLLTLGGLALGIGMMVDNAIVILENIDRNRQQGMSLTEASLIGTQEVVKPLVAATLTTVIVFLPMLFVEGLAGQLFRPLALVVSLALLSSLITSFFFVPVLSTHLLPDRHKSASENRSAANRSTQKRALVTERFSRTFSRLRSAYLHLLGWSLRRPGKVALVLIAVVLLSFVCLPLIGTEFLPHLDESVLYMTVRLPIGTPLEQTRSTALDVVERIEDIPEIQAVYTSVGGTGEFQVAAGTLSNRANFSIPLSPVGERSRSDHDIADDIRSRLHNVPGANITVSAGETSGLGGPPLAVQVRGPDTEVLASLAENIRSRISLIDGVEGIETAVESSQEEVRITPDRFRAAQHGISTAQIAEKIREATQGIVATRIQRQGDELDVRLAYYDGNVNQLDRLGWLEIESAHGINVPLSQLVTITEDTRPHTIARTDHLRQTEVRAQLYNRDLGSTMREIRQALEEDIVLPNGYSIHFGGQNDDMIEAFYYLGMALIVAVLLVYMVLAAQFESLTHPLLIMLAIPLAFAGTFIGLWMTGRPLGVGAMVGLLILSGIVVNNAIVFVDYVESMRKNGMTRQEALLQAGSVRIRPILMTTLTTVLGLLPLTLGIGEGSEIQAPLATTVVFGLTFATVLTLIWIPVMYELLEWWKEKHASNASE